MNCVIKFTYTFCNDMNKQSASISIKFRSEQSKCILQMADAFIAWPRKDCEGTQRLRGNAKSLRGNAITLRGNAITLRGNAKLCEGTQKYCVPSQSLRSLAKPFLAFARLRKDCVASQSIAFPRKRFARERKDCEGTQ